MNMVSIEVWHKENVQQIQITPKSTIAEFKEQIISVFKIPNQMKIYAKIEESNIAIDLETNDQQKIMDKYKLQNNDKIIISLPIRRLQTPIHNQQSKQVSNGCSSTKSVLPNINQCRNCRILQDGKFIQQIEEINQLQEQLLSYSDLQPIKQQQNYMEYNIKEQDYISQGGQTETGFGKTYSLQGQLQSEEMTKLFNNQMEVFNKSIEQSKNDSQKIQELYQRQIKDKNDEIARLKSQSQKDIETQKKIFEQEILKQQELNQMIQSNQEKEIQRLNDQISVLVNKINTLKELV